MSVKHHQLLTEERKWSHINVRIIIKYTVTTSSETSNKIVYSDKARGLSSTGLISFLIFRRSLLNFRINHEIQFLKSVFVFQNQWHRSKIIVAGMVSTIRNTLIIF